MISDQDLLKKFKTILNLEIAAAKIYQENIDEFEDDIIRNKLGEIKKDEDKHVDYAKKILTIVEK